MAKFVSQFFNYFNMAVPIVFLLIVIYIILFPFYLRYYFESALGRLALLLFIIAMTFCIPIMGILTTVIFIGLYNSRVYEGLETMSTDTKTAEEPAVTEEKPAVPTSTTTGAQPSTVASPIKTPEEPVVTTSQPATVTPAIEAKKEEKKMDTSAIAKEGFNNRLNYSELDEGRNKMLTIENYIRKPKSSNQMPFTKYKAKMEPMANYSGKEGFSSFNSSA